MSFSKSGRTIYYGDKAFRSLNGAGFKAKFYDLETHEQLWISGPRKDGDDRLYGERVGVEIDENVREEYWCDVRQRPELKHQSQT